MRPKLTYANVVATLALFIAIGGASAFAASQLGKNSVGTKQLKNNAITTAKIKNGAVTGAKVNLSSLGTVPSASTANTANTANSAKIATNVLSANVAANGLMLGSIPSGATSTRTEVGHYSVNMGREINGCTISASLASNGAPQPGFVAVGVANANTLTVVTSNGSAFDLPFYVQAICPAG